MAVLCAVAYHQPIDRAGLVDIFGKEINRDLLARLRYEDLIATGPRSPRPGAPHTFVTTETFLAMFDLQSLRDLPELQLGLDEGSAESMVESVWRPNGSGLYLSVAGAIPAPFSRISSAGRRNVYVMDNHRAALWGWLQELDLKQPHSLIHIDRHPDALQNRLDECLQHLPDWSAGIDTYLAKNYETDGFDCPVIRWDKYLSIYLHAFGKNLKVSRVHRHMIWNSAA